VNARRSDEAEDVWVLEARGRIDANVAPELEAHLEALLAAGHNRLIVDFRRVSYISSSGLKILLIALRAARQNAGDLKLCALNDRVHEVFAISGFYKIFGIYRTESEAAVAFEGGEERQRE
jgi:anti-anti-sigma factor